MLLMGKSTISMAIFRCYVSSPEGIWFQDILKLDDCKFPYISITGETTKASGEAWGGVPHGYPVAMDGGWTSW